VNAAPPTNDVAPRAATPARAGAGLAATAAGIATLVVTLNLLIVNVAFTSISRNLDASLAAVQWVATGYVLGMMATVALAEWLSALLGLKRLLLLGLGVFLVASILCGLAPSVGSLIVFRVIAGIAGGVVPPVSHALVVRAAGRVRLGAAMTVLNGHVVAAPIFGPALGGLLVVGLGWRWIFFASVPLTVAAMLLSWWALPADEETAKRQLDVGGLVLLTGGLVLLVYGLAEFGRASGRSTAELATGAGLVLTIAFVLHARRVGERAILDISILAHRRAAVPVLVTAGTSMTLFGSAAILPLYFEDGRGETAVVAGVILAAQGIGSAVGMFFGGRVADRRGIHVIAPLGATIALLATLPWTHLVHDSSYFVLVTFLVIRGAGISALLIANYTAAYGSAEPSALAATTAILSTVQRVFAAAGVALFIGVLQTRVPNVTALGSAASSDALTHAFSYTFTWMAAISALTIVPALALSKSRRVPTRTEIEPST
jgi:EmrB/QacA subfamily drug resistance transporter